MTQDAVVTKLLPDNMAEVAVARTTACGGNCGSCESCIFQSQLKTPARNLVGAKPGQRVIIQSKSSAIYKAALLVYVFPMVLTLLGYVLAYLAGHPNRVFTRDQLLDEVWGFEYYGDSRTIDVHVKRLREKLSGASDKWELKTVWGVGYKFEVRQ